MKVKIKTRALARRLANNKLKEIYGEDAIWEENTNEFQGLVYKKEVKSDAETYFKYFLEEIREHIIYPFREGETYYTIIKSGDRHEIQESVWDDISEELYRNNPETKFFKKESEALIYMAQLKKD